MENKDKHPLETVRRRFDPALKPFLFLLRRIFNVESSGYKTNEYFTNKDREEIDARAKRAAKELWHHYMRRWLTIRFKPGRGEFTYAAVSVQYKIRHIQHQIALIKSNIENIEKQETQSPELLLAKAELNKKLKEYNEGIARLQERGVLGLQPDI